MSTVDPVDGHDGVDPVDGPALRLSFDASAVPASPVGAGRYTIELARALATCGQVDMSVWCRKGDDGRLRARIDGKSRLLPDAPVRRPVRLLWEQVSLSRRVDAIGADVHHAPHYTMPERCKTPVVVTVHDLTFLEHPEWHERSKVLVFSRALRVASRRASVLVCVSTRTAEALEERLEPRGRVVVVPHGVDRLRFHPADPAHDESDREALGRVGVKEPYILFVGTLEPRKGVPDLVAAFDRLAPGRPELSLVIAGGRGWGVEPIERAISVARHTERIVRTGYVDDSAVGVLTRRAQVVAYPAYEEGFGLPALEALACATPLVTTEDTAMAEVAAGAAALVRRGDVPGLADAIEEALDRGPGVRDRVSAGCSVAASNTWEASARRHIEAYRIAAG